MSAGPAAAEEPLRSRREAPEERAFAYTGQLQLLCRRARSRFRGDARIAQRRALTPRKCRFRPLWLGEKHFQHGQSELRHATARLCGFRSPEIGAVARAGKHRQLPVLDQPREFRLVLDEHDAGHIFERLHHFDALRHEAGEIRMRRRREISLAQGRGHVLGRGEREPFAHA